MGDYINTGPRSKDWGLRTQESEDWGLRTQESKDWGPRTQESEDWGLRTQESEDWGLRTQESDSPQCYPDFFYPRSIYRPQPNCSHEIMNC